MPPACPAESHTCCYANPQMQQIGGEPVGTSWPFGGPHLSRQSWRPHLHGWKRKTQDSQISYSRTTRDFLFELLTQFLSQSEKGVYLTRGFHLFIELISTRASKPKITIIGELKGAVRGHCVKDRTYPGAIS